MQKQKQGPVLFNELFKQHYQVSILFSAEIYIPPYDKTIFQDIKNLKIRTPGKTPGDRDRHITSEFIQFINHRDQTKPFFSFLFYNAAHGYCRPQPFAQPFQPAIKECNRIALTNNSNPVPYLNRYKNALHFIDDEIALVLDTLKKQHLSNHTIVIITGDHGQEFNDNLQNHWEHASNYSKYQIQTPLIINWPNKNPKIFNHNTSHYDIIPLLMQRVLRCQNPSSDYSIGKNIFHQKSRNYLIAGSYINFAIIEPDRITTVNPSGNISVTDLHLKQKPTLKPHVDIIKKAMRDMRKFYQVI